MRRVLIAVTVVALVVGGAVALRQLGGTADDGDDPAARADAVISVGLLEPTAAQIGELSGSSLSRIAVDSSWARLEPSEGGLDPAAVLDLLDRIRAAHVAGLGVVLDLGLQYPPPWVFDLPGSTRFVDQYGDEWHGKLSEEVPNAVFNIAVRRAQARYVAELGIALRAAPLAGVRVGGLLSGELRYPPTEFNGHADALWAFDSDALAASPDPSWRPGQGTEASAHAVLSWYVGMLTDYLRFLLDAVTAAFAGVERQVLLPSWGLRPGMLDQAARTRFGPETPSDVADLVGAGLDWQSQVALMASRPGVVVPYSTWLDAPDHGSDQRRVAPIAYLADLAAPFGLPLGGENTGGNGEAALGRTLSQARRFHLRTVMFMSGGFIQDGRAGLTLTDLQQAAAAATR